MLVSAQNSVVSQNKSEVWGQFSVCPQLHTVWKCLRTHLAPLWGFLQWLSLVFSLGVRRAGASPGRSPLHLSPTLKMYCSRRAWNMLARQTGLWPCKSGWQPKAQQTMPPSSLLSRGLLWRGWRLDLLSSGCGALHNFRGNPDEEAPQHWSGPCHLDRLQRSRVVMSAPPSVLPACLISGSCDVQ